MAKKITVHTLNYSKSFEYEGVNMECGATPSNLLVVAERVPDVTGKSDSGTTNHVVAQFQNWDAVEVSDE